VDRLAEVLHPIAACNVRTARKNVPNSNLLLMNGNNSDISSFITANIWSRRRLLNALLNSIVSRACSKMVASNLEKRISRLVDKITKVRQLLTLFIHLLKVKCLPVTIIWSKCPSFEYDRQQILTTSSLECLQKCLIPSPKILFSNAVRLSIFLW